MSTASTSSTGSTWNHRHAATQLQHDLGLVIASILDHWPEGENLPADPAERHRARRGRVGLTGLVKLAGLLGYTLEVRLLRVDGTVVGSATTTRPT